MHKRIHNRTSQKDLSNQSRLRQEFYVKSRQEQWSIKVNYEQQFSRNIDTFIATSRYILSTNKNS